MDSNTLDFRCPLCSKKYLVPHDEGYFLRIKGALFEKSSSEPGKVKCKSCGKWFSAPVYINI